MAGAVLVSTGLGSAQAQWPPAPPPPPYQEQYVQAEPEVLTRGPVHEAFAEPVVFDPEPELIAPAAPPDPIDEMPPEYRPDGPNMEWIPGYWAWDDERNDFLWVSGVWRSVPPGRQWVPGYWARGSHGFIWTAGYWVDIGVQDIDYLPEPPETLDIAPPPQPSPDYVWVPGCWVWYHGRYAWRPGYWLEGRPDWMWVPAHYVWAPPGHVFVDGYWDYAIQDRGVLFAPVYFQQPVYQRTVVHYSPSVVIDIDILTDHMFARPAYNHYYFGDYYEPWYRERGFHFSFSFHRSRYGYDPIFAHRRWRHRHDRDWDVRVQATFAKRRDFADARPPRTFAEQRRLNVRRDDVDGRSRILASRVDEYAQRRESPMRMRTVSQDERRQMIDRGKEVRRVRSERADTEARVRRTPPEQQQVQRQPEARQDPRQPDAREPRQPDPRQAQRPEQPTQRPEAREQPTRIKMPRSPIRREASEARDRTPPRRPDAPAPDQKVEPRPRERGKHRIQRDPNPDRGREQRDREDRARRRP